MEARGRTITDSNQVQQIVEFVDGQRRGWGLLDIGGVPVPEVTVEFYNGEEFRGSFGVGDGFFECQREGDFASKFCGLRDQRRFLELIGETNYKFRR